MTDDYKERVIKWLTGNYDIEQSNTDPLIGDLEQTTTTINSYFDTILGYIQGKDGKGNDLDLGFIYGNKNNKGVIVVVDNDFNIIQDIDEYNTGTNFNEWICLNIDITNGNIYGIDWQSNKYRFILLNNFLVKPPAQQNYEVKLRNSYFLTFSDNTFVPRFVDKKPTEALYIFIGEYDYHIPQIGTFYRPYIVTYQIIVGGTNEQHEYNSTEYYAGDIKLKTYNPIWADPTFTIKLAGFRFEPYDVNLYRISYNEFLFDGTDIIETENVLIINSSYYRLSTMFDKNSSFVLTNTECYITYVNNNSVSILAKYNYDDNYFDTIDSITSTDENNVFYVGGKIIKVNNQLFYYLYANEDDDQTLSNINISIKFGKINYSNNDIYLTTKQYDNKKIYEMLDIQYNTILNVSNIYNLYTYYLIGSNSNILLNVQQIFNELNYNYEDYQDISSLIPNSGILYNDNKIIFARNLYNKVINGNTTMASVEVPNMLLNDIDIDLQELWGQTNGVLVENTETIQKNIYEDLFINFYNTITMQNQNTQDYIYNLTGATRLNNSISNLKDYANVKITKIRMNYSDDTTFIKNVEPATQISQFVYQFEFNVYVPLTKGITSIELISDDELTSYQTIDTTSLVLGKSYKITQNVEIGE